MKINLTVDCNINIPKHMKKVQDDNFWLFSINEWYKLYTPFVPMKEGPLSQNVRMKPKECEHIVPYAKRNYEGDFNFSKDQHPLASRHWDKAAWPTQGQKLISSMQGYIDSGRLNLND